MGFRALEPRWLRHRARRISSLATFEGRQEEWGNPVKLGLGPSGPNRSEEKGPRMATGAFRGRVQLCEPGQGSGPGL